MLILLAITLGLLIATLFSFTFYWVVVRQSERNLWAREIRRADRHAREAHRLAIVTISRWQMLQGFPSLEDELNPVDRKEEDEQDEPESLLRLSDEDLTERLMAADAPRSGVTLEERRRMAREAKRRLIPPRPALEEEPEEDFTGGPVNELSMDQTSHLRAQ